MKREKERKEGQKKRLRGLWGRQISNCQVNVSNRQIPKLDRFLTNDVKKNKPAQVEGELFPQPEFRS